MAASLSTSCLLAVALCLLALLGGGSVCSAKPLVLEEDAAVEVVGGVEAAAEKVTEEAAADDADAKEGEDGEAADADDAKDEPEPDPPTPGESILKDLDFDPEDNDYEEKLASLFVDAEALKKIRKQIEDLDAEDFRDRNDASKALAMVEAPIEHLLGAARKEASVEMSRRIQSILQVRVSQRRLDALYHAAGRIVENDTPGFAPQLLVISATFEPEIHWDLLRMLELAVAKSATEQERELLEAALQAPESAVRETAAFALSYMAAADNNGAEQSNGYEAADDDGVALAAARGLAAAGSAQASGQLLKLLSSDQVRVRQEAGHLLRVIYQKDQGFAAYDPEDRRKQAKEAWKNHLSNSDLQVEPVILGVGARSSFEVLVGKKPAKDGTVLSWTTSGKKIGQHELSAAMGGINPTSIQFDDRAGRIIASGGGAEDGRITLFTSNGVELWNAAGFPAGGGAAALPNGHMMVAIGTEVEELDVIGARVSSWDVGKQTSSFSRLREGRYLCVHPEAGEVAEYGADQKLIWSMDGLHEPRQARRLANGHLLIVTAVKKSKKEEEDEESSDISVELLETDPAGRILTRIRPKGVSNIYCAARLPNGNTLIGTEKGLAEYTPEGYATKVWLKSVITSLHVR